MLKFCLVVTKMDRIRSESMIVADVEDRIIEAGDLLHGPLKTGGRAEDEVPFWSDEDG